MGNLFFLVCPIRVLAELEGGTFAVPIHLLQFGSSNTITFADEIT